ncbi:RNA polymerase sigma factor [Acidobacteriota bacterium]
MLKHRDMEDNQLVKNCLEGRMEDFKLIMDRYTGKAMAMAINILGSREDAEDVCQDVFIRVFHNLERFDPHKKFKDWLYAILYNRCMDILRKRTRFYKYFQKTSGELKESQRINDEEIKTSKELPQKFLLTLSPRERTALVLWANESYTGEEIGNVLNCSSSTARVYLYKARKKIKERLEEKNANL